MPQFRIGQQLTYTGPRRKASYGETVHTGDPVWVVQQAGSVVNVKIGNGCTCTYGSFNTTTDNLRA